MKFKEHRLFMEENRKFQAAARAKAERIIRKEGSLEALDSVPVLQEAVKAMVEKWIPEPNTNSCLLFEGCGQ